MTAGKRMLVVDDDPQVTDLIATIADEGGFEVHTLNDSSDFFSSYGAINPDVLCIDIHMPEVDGIEILRWLSGEGCRASVIILSGGDPLFSTVAQRIGEAAKLDVATIEKPFDINDFRDVLGGRRNGSFIAPQTQGWG